MCPMTRHYPSSGASSIQSKLIWKEWPSTENAFGEIPYMKIITQGNVSPRSAWKIHRSQFNCGIRILGYISSWQQNLAGNSHSTCFTGIKDARMEDHGNLCQGPRGPLRPGNVWQGQTPGKQVWKGHSLTLRRWSLSGSKIPQGSGDARIRGRPLKKAKPTMWNKLKRETLGDDISTARGPGLPTLLRVYTITSWAPDAGLRAAGLGVSLLCFSIALV